MSLPINKVLSDKLDEFCKTKIIPNILFHIFLIHILNHYFVFLQLNLYKTNPFHTTCYIYLFKNRVNQ